MVASEVAMEAWWETVNYVKTAVLVASAEKKKKLGGPVPGFHVSDSTGCLYFRKNFKYDNEWVILKSRSYFDDAATMTDYDYEAS